MLYVTPESCSSWHLYRDYTGAGSWGLTVAYMGVNNLRSLSRFLAILSHDSEAKEMCGCKDRAKERRIPTTHMHTLMYVYIHINLYVCVCIRPPHTHTPTLILQP